jgi:hypothetical protein
MSGKGNRIKGKVQELFNIYESIIIYEIRD